MKRVVVEVLCGFVALLAIWITYTTLGAQIEKLRVVEANQEGQAAMGRKLHHAIAEAVDTKQYLYHFTDTRGQSCLATPNSRDGVVRTYCLSTWEMSSEVSVYLPNFK